MKVFNINQNEMKINFMQVEMAFHLIPYILGIFPTTESYLPGCTIFSEFYGMFCNQHATFKVIAYQVY